MGGKRLLGKFLNELESFVNLKPHEWTYQFLLQLSPQFEEWLYFQDFRDFSSGEPTYMRKWMHLVRRDTSNFAVRGGSDWNRTGLPESKCCQHRDTWKLTMPCCEGAILCTGGCLMAPLIKRCQQHPSTSTVMRTKNVSRQAKCLMQGTTVLWSRTFNVLAIPLAFTHSWVPSNF